MVPGIGKFLKIFLYDDVFPTVHIEINDAGVIMNVVIDRPGYGFSTPLEPSIIVFDPLRQGSGAVLSVESLDSNGV